MFCKDKVEMSLFVISKKLATEKSVDFVYRFLPSVEMTRQELSGSRAVSRFLATLEMTTLRWSK